MVANSFYKISGENKHIKEACRKIYCAKNIDYKNAKVLISELV